MPRPHEQLLLQGSKMLPYGDAFGDLVHIHVSLEDSKMPPLINTQEWVQDAPPRDASIQYKASTFIKVKLPQQIQVFASPKRIEIYKCLRVENHFLKTSYKDSSTYSYM
ncbi:hypothetical protein V6N12_069681 [Hibiscus sabdariffa]|uniref:Uncharacterized protein n=1 Tax=Hibiscus sabdariffa TaxID=183260 RepID=A0ABR2FEM5_9ROSI